MARDWSRAENEATVASYFAMLEAGLRGEPVNKTEQRNRLLPLLENRTKGAVEFKHQNISAVLLDLRVPYLSGYLPALNYQQDLRDVVLAQLMERRVLREVIEQSALSVPVEPESVDPVQVFEPPPQPRERRRREAGTMVRSPVDYLQLEAGNRQLGLAGERFVIDLERERLERAGKGNLAAQVSHVAIERGDGLGYDVLSFEEDSREMLIEVKTTKYGEYTPFYVSRNELDVSEQRAAFYHLYRVHSFGAQPRIFRKIGALADSFDVSPASYIARVG